MISELMLGWPAALQLQVSAYTKDHRLDPAALLRVDLALILCRIGGADADAALAGLTGRAITKCPSAVPPWPPRAPAGPAGPPAARLIKVAANPCPPTTAMHGRYAKLRKGMTREQVLARGCTARDIRYWQERGHIAFT